MRFKDSKGMTLVEILIATSIILLIASMIIPSFYNARAKTRRAICISNLRLLQAGGDRYCIEEKVSDLSQIDDNILLNSEYIIEKLRCPENNVEYSPFVIRNGPRCPNIVEFPDHKLGD